MNSPIVSAIHKISRYSPDMIQKVIDMGERGLPPIHLPGTMQYTIWMMYKVIQEYERIGTIEPRESG